MDKRGEILSDIFAFNGSSNAGWSQPKPILPISQIKETVPKSMLRSNPPAWPRASEPELVRHYTWLSRRNFGIDTREGLVLLSATSGTSITLR